MVMNMSMTLIHFQLFNLAFMSSVGCQVFIDLNGDVLKATVFELVSDRLFTDLHVVDML